MAHKKLCSHFNNDEKTGGNCSARLCRKRKDMKWSRYLLGGMPRCNGEKSRRRMGDRAFIAALIGTHQSQKRCTQRKTYWSLSRAVSVVRPLFGNDRLYIYSAPTFSCYYRICSRLKLFQKTHPLTDKRDARFKAISRLKCNVNAE